MSRLEDLEDRVDELDDVVEELETNIKFLKHQLSIDTEGNRVKRIRMVDGRTNIEVKEDE